MCPSCDTQANSCDWCVSYASLVGARVKLTRAAAAGPSLAAGWESASSGALALCPPSPERWAIVEFFRDFSSTAPAAAAVVLAISAAAAAALTLPARRGPRGALDETPARALEWHQDPRAGY
jgi:hypothetical protein